MQHDNDMTRPRDATDLFKCSALPLSLEMHAVLGYDVLRLGFREYECKFIVLYILTLFLVRLLVYFCKTKK